MKTLMDHLNNNPRKLWNRSVRKNSEWMEWLSELYPNILTLNEKLHLLYNRLDNPPTCAVDTCNNKVNWINDTHYGETCSYQCSQLLRKQKNKMDEIQEKMRTTMMDRYGVDNPGKSQEVQAKRISTMITRYGSKISPKSRESLRVRAGDLNAKARATIKERYGVENIQQVPEIREKTKRTMSERYGATNPSGIPEVKVRRQMVKQERWNEIFSNVTILDETIPFEMIGAYPNVNKRIRFKCNICSFEEKLPSETLKYRHRKFGNACSNCCKISPSSSRDETEIGEYIQSLGIDIERNTKNLIPPKEIDIWIPSKRVGIEYCGLYWHGESRGKDRIYHLTKHNLCADQNIRLITIFEDEWQNKVTIVKSRLAHLFGNDQRRIMARKCKVSKIDSGMARKFCEANHLQGAGIAKLSFGLYHENELVSVMTFADLNIAKGSRPRENTWELSRFCSALDTNVIGGASKIFNAFIKEINPEQVLSYSDIRWNTGALYNSLGFENQGNTSPNYWYIDLGNVKRLHRFGLRKNANDDQNLTEWENRQLQGWDRIWDCGNTRWLWSKK